MWEELIAVNNNEKGLQDKAPALAQSLVHVSCITAIAALELGAFSSSIIFGSALTITATLVATLLTRMLFWNRIHSFILVALPLVIGAFLAIHFTTASSPAYYVPSTNQTFLHIIDNNQYGYLADSLINGDLSLDLPVSEELADLPNPYDYSARYEIASNDGAQIYWDYAFYDGEYFSYFGVIPALLLFVPFRIITGAMLSTPMAIALLGILYICFAALLTVRFAEQYFPTSITRGSVLISWMIVIAASNVFYLGFVSRFYSIPILTSMCITMLGLWFWLGAKTAPHQSRQQPPISSARISIGTMLMVMNIGCRPQFTLACFLAVPIFWKEIVKDRVIFSRKYPSISLAIIIPIVIVLVPLLWYNAARFGSPFNIGSNYNLTGFDMTSYNQDWRNTLLSLFYYLFQPVDFARVFPFINATSIPLPYGWAPSEPMFGGLFALVPGILLCLFVPYMSRELKSHHVFSLVVLMFIFACITLLLDIRQAGVTQRYFSDFSWYLSFISIIILFAMQERFRSSTVLKRRAFWSAISACLLFSIIVGCLSFISPNRYDSIAELNPSLYSSIESIFTTR